MTTVALSSTASLAAEIASASKVRVGCYTLANRTLEAALVGAAARGATVKVVLARAPVEDRGGAIAAHNAATVAWLRDRGVDASLSPTSRPSPHLKAAIVDRVAFLDDQNFRSNGGDTVVRDTDRRDVAAIDAALDGRALDGSAVRTAKADALRDEAAAIATGSGHEIDVESEAFGAGSFVYGALKARALAHDRVSLIVSERELHGPGAARECDALRDLSAAGVAVRVTATQNDKLAFAGDRGWIGSANATYPVAAGPDEWGLTTHDPAIGDALRARFLATWAAAAPFSG